jgi:phenylacetic acid degradation operon negative regulatory protein
LRDRFPDGIPGTWFVDALGEVGVDARAVRQTLLRMTKTGVLRAVRAGRANVYAPMPATWSILDAGRARLTEAVTDEWDEQWTIVHLRFEDRDREMRDRLRDVMLVRGFGRLRSGVYLHPRDQVDLVLDAAASLGAAQSISVFRGHRHGPPGDAQLTRELWDLAALAMRYRAFVERFSPVADAGPRRWSHRQAFALRFAYMFELFRITWDDPSLPARFLPDDWPGRAARTLAEHLRTQLRPGAIAFANEIAARRSAAAE